MEQALPRTEAPLLPNRLLGIFFVIASEAMLFTGFISSYLVARAAANIWPPPGQPRLPIEATALNTVALLLSGLCFAMATAVDVTARNRRQLWLVASLSLGIFFVSFQGTEWLNLIRFGLTTSSSLYGSYFYLIVGAHALHVLVGLLILAYYVFHAPCDENGLSSLKAFGFFWYFVVLLWPVLYALVYLY